MNGCVAGIGAGRFVRYAALVLLGFSVSVVVRGATVEEELQKMADEINAHLPQEIDETTRLDRIVAGPGKMYAYHYTIRTQLDDEQKQQLREVVAQQALATKEMRPIFNAGVTVWYKYFDSQGRSIVEFPVSGTIAQTPAEKGRRIGFVFGVLVGGLVAGFVCGAGPLYLASRRGRPLLGITAMIICTLGGLIYGLLAGVPLAILFVVVILCLPAVRDDRTVDAEMI